MLNPVKVHGHNNIQMYTETVDYIPVLELCKSGLVERSWEAQQSFITLPAYDHGYS